MPFKMGHFKLQLPSSPCKRCLLFFEGKGRQAADADPGALIPFPLPSQAGIPCTIYLFLMSAYILNPFDPVQEHYIVKREQVPFSRNYSSIWVSYLAFFTVSLGFPAAAFEKHFAKPSKSQNVGNKQFIIILPGSKC